MLQRERWERTAVDTEAAREIDMRDRQSMYSSALKTTLGATIIAAMVTVSLFHALPGEELRQHFAALVKAAAIALGCIFAVVSMSKLSDGVDRRSLMMTVGAVFWTVLCVPLLCMVGQEAAIAKNASEPFGSLLALIAAGWLISLGSLAMFILSIALVDRFDAAPFLIFLGVIGIFVGLIVGTVGSRMIRPVKITDTHVHVKGCHAEFLNRFPLWTFG